MLRAFVSVVVLGLCSVSAHAQDKKDEPTDPIQPKAVFRGSREFTKGPSAGKTVEVELQITKRKKDAFSGTVKYAGKNLFKVTGTDEDGDIKWKEQPLRGDAPGTPVKGVLKDDKLILTFKGTGASGQLIEGTMDLDLEEKK